MEYRKAKIDEIKIINEMYRAGSKTLNERGVDQWQGVNLPVASLENIEKIYVLEDEEEIVSTALHMDHDPDYDKIYEGEWLSDGSYYAIHRVTTQISKSGKGYTNKMFDEIEKLAKENGKDSVRVDTHKENMAMQKTLAKSGYTNCGIVYLYNGVPRLAYEKLIK
ncbi:GNAT family N-acetyltransferase [Peptoniphilus asaccharolyticus]